MKGDESCLMKGSSWLGPGEEGTIKHWATKNGAEYICCPLNKYGEKSSIRL